MIPDPRKPFLPVLALSLSILACNLPGLATRTPFAFPTPNLTLTTVFDPNQVPQASSTLPLPGTSAVTPAPATLSPTAPSSPTSLPSPTFTSPPATATSAPPTATQIPPTATTKPTNTQVSFAGPDRRQGPGLTASRFSVEPKIDGVFEEWNLERYPVANVIVDAGYWVDASDLSGDIMLGWDASNLYIAARVRDDFYVQNATGENLYKGDSVEVLFDADVASDFYLDSLSGDDYQLGISPGYGQANANPEAYLWYPQSIAGNRQKVKASTSPMEGGYRVEMKIPWDVLGAVPGAGRHFGFAFSVSDNDSSDRSAQQSLVSNVATRVFTDPTTWGDLVLSGSAAPQPNPNPQSRTGPSINAVFLSTPPQLDGSLGEWSLAASPVSSLVFGSDKWDSAADLSGSVMTGWDNTNLYLGIQVLDNRFVQNTTGENIFLGDSLELLLDAGVAGDFYDRNLNGDDFQLGLSPGNPSPGTTTEAFLWYPASQSGARSQVKVVAAATGDGYIVEAVIPWSVFGITPANLQHYGFAFSISDNDNLNQSAQQSLVSNVPSRVLTDPTSWGDLTLTRP